MRGLSELFENPAKENAVTNVYMRMQTFVCVTTGMRVLYSPPYPGDSFQAEQFFAAYKNKTGVVHGFALEHVSVLDPTGRLPGVYYNPKSLQVVFEGETKSHSLNINNLILLESTSTHIPSERLDLQKKTDLPIKFYPEDLVRKSEDPLRTPREVLEVAVHEGNIRYVLAESAAEAEARRLRTAADTTPRPFMRTLDHPATETVAAEDIQLIAGGNIRHLYCEPEKLRFSSAPEELRFWSRNGISHQVFVGEMEKLGRYSLEGARGLLEAGTGDLVLEAKLSSNPNRKYEVRRLFPCFEQHRDRVRSISLALKQPPAEREQSLRECVSALAAHLSQ